MSSVRVVYCKENLLLAVVALRNAVLETQRIMI